MLALRDQENLVHANQTTAAGKVSYHSVRGLQPKTPSNGPTKTPFGKALNDENKPVGFNVKNTGLKGVSKGTENILQTTKKDGKADKTSFVTPLGPRTRAPLGAKTTNAKGQAIQTPRLVQQTIKPKRPSTTRKSIKSKITVASSEPVEADVLVLKEDDVPEDDVPDIEYAPPPPTELPDPPEVFEYDQTFPQFKGANMCRGWGEIYLAEPRDEHGVLVSLREYEEKCARHDKEVERQMKESLENMTDLGTELDKQVDAMVAAGPRYKAPQESRIDTMRARGAADALSHPRAPTAAMKPTASSLQKSRKPDFSVLSSREAPGPTNPSPMRHTAAEAVSKNTIGFPRARHAPSIIPPKLKKAIKIAEVNKKPPINQHDIHPARFCELYGTPPEGSDMWLRLREHELLGEEVREYDVAGDVFSTNFIPPEENDGEVFQLSMPS